MKRTDEMKSRRRLQPSGGIAALAIGAAALLSGGATALAAGVPVLERSQLERSLGTDEARQSYHETYDEAKRLEVAPKRNIAAGQARSPELVSRLAVLEGEVAKAKVEREIERIEEAAEPDFGTLESVGVSQSTLDAIASCESGGSPTIVDASGTYHGKYQFDVGTWASVGGSGLPSAAPEAEQDYRAALLYSQAGSSPWPVCG